ncbi:cytochrome P450 [Streptomyces hygroscopicus]|uniref:cytochrome P450 n=1 Tax=Streptomyces hygroscopicus TaxID=1912 RepID=UPI00223F82D7|nr:cytochrome P450 [Streptomyces hygroscopicus]
MTVTPAAPTALLAEPYWFRHLPTDRDVHRLEDGVYAVTGNAAVHAALSHPAILAEHPLKASARAFGPNVLDADGPEHKAFRALLAPVLSAARIDEYKQQLMPRLINALVDDLAGVETNDFYDTYAHKIPYGIVCTILGIDLGLERRFHALTRPLARLLDFPTVETAETHANTAELLGIIEKQRAARHGDGASLLDTIERTRDRKGINLSDSEVRSTALLFFIAGTETSSAFITSLVYCMGRLMFGMDELADPAVRDAFVEEVLRLFPPVQTAVRFAGEDVEIAGETIPRHSAVLTSIAGANRDPRIFPHPDRFEVSRSRKQSMPFAAGAHSCPGFALAKAEFSLLIEAIIGRFSRITVTRDRRRMDSQSFSHPVDFTVQFTTT